MRNVDLGIGWSAQVIRLSIFPQEAGALENLDFSMLAGVQAEQEEKRPRERFKRQAVAFHDGILELQVSPLRADFLYLPRAQFSGPIPDVAELLLPEPFSDRLHEFMSPIVNAIGALEASITRLALGATLVVQFNTRADAYGVLKKCLRSVQVEAGMEDLLYRVNWRANSNDPELIYINRLTTWSIATARVVSVAGTVQQAIPEKYLAQLELDISTPAENISNISQGIRVNICKSLAKLAIENASSGEIKNDR